MTTRTTTKLQRYWRGTAAAPLPPDKVGSYTPVGDQAASLAYAHAGDGLMPPEFIGNTWDASDVTVATLETNRPHWQLVAWVPYPAVVKALRWHLEGGTAAHTYRAGLYGVTSNVTPTMVDFSSVRPTSALITAAPQTLAANAPAGLYTTTLDYPMPSGGFVAPFIWPNATANGMKRRYFPNGTAALYTRTTGLSAFAYAATGDPPAYSVAGSNVTVNSRVELLYELIVHPLAPSTPGSFTGTPTGRRGALFAWAPVAGAERYRIVRRTAAGSLGSVVVPGSDTSYEDVDLPANTEVFATLYACAGPVASLASTEIAVTTQGVRQATVEGAPATIWPVPDHPGRGLSGITHTVPGVAPHTAKKHVGIGEWRNSETRSYATDTPVYNFSQPATYLSSLPSHIAGWIGFRAWRKNDGVPNSAPDFVRRTGLSSGGFLTTGQTGPLAYISSMGDLIPRWPAIASYYLDFMDAAGAALTTHPRLQILDIRGWGQWGELRVWGNYPPSIADLKALIDRVAAAFPNQILVIAAMENTEDEALTYALETYGPDRLWVRQDALGDPAGATQIKEMWLDRSPKARRLMRDPRRFLTCEHYAPGTAARPENWTRAGQELDYLGIGMVCDTNLAEFSAQSASNQAEIVAHLRRAGPVVIPRRYKVPAGIVRGEPFPVLVTYENTGNAPVYLPWRPQFELRPTGGGAAVATWPASRTLQRLLPGERVTHADTFTLATSAAVTVGAAYPLHLRAPGATAYPGAQDLAFGIAGAQGTATNRSYELIANCTIVA